MMPTGGPWLTLVEVETSELIEACQRIDIAYNSCNIQACNSTDFAFGSGQLLREFEQRQSSNK